MLQPIVSVGGSGVYNVLFLRISHGLCFAGVHRQHACMLCWSMHRRILGKTGHGPPESWG